MCVKKCEPVSECNQVKALISALPNPQAQVFSGVILTKSYLNKQGLCKKLIQKYTKKRSRNL